MNRFEQYELDVSRWVSQQTNCYNPTGVNSISVFISLNNLTSFEDVNVLRSFEVLEQITGQKAYLSKYASKFVGSTRKVSATIAVTLRKDRMYNFLDYLITVLLPNEVRRYGKLRISRDHSDFCVGLKDWSALIGFQGDEVKGVLNILVRTKGTVDSFSYLQLLLLSLVKK